MSSSPQSTHGNYPAVPQTFRTQTSNNVLHAPTSILPPPSAWSVNPSAVLPLCHALSLLMLQFQHSSVHTHTYTLAHSFSRLSVAAEHALTVASTGTFRLKHTHINLQSSDKVCWGWEVSLYEGVFKMFSYMFAPILAAVQEMAPHIHPVIIHAASTLSLNICVPIFVHLLSPLNNSDSTQKQSLKISKLTYSTWIWPLTYKNNQLLSFGSNVSLCFLC